MIIISISGKKQSGKDTVATLIASHLDVKPYIRIAFADALKEEVARVCGVTTKDIEQDKERFRPILQWWGTDFRRHFKGEYYWIEKMLHKLISTVSELVLIPDTRFPNEYKTLSDLGAFMIKVESNRCSNTDVHPSETALDDYPFDLVIQNNGTVAELNQQIKQICIDQLAQLKSQNSLKSA